jgi:hypothetical protein
MNGFFSIMSDVASVAAGGTEAERAAARRIRTEWEHKAAARTQSIGLHPAAIIAVGNAEPPVERLIGLQCAAAKVVQLIASLPRWGRAASTTQRRMSSPLPRGRSARSVG